MTDARIAVVGGSIAGCLTAAALERAGFDVVVLERSKGGLGERGAGITLPGPLVENLKASELADGDFEGRPLTAREWRTPEDADPLGRLQFSEPMAGAVMYHWGALFHNLRRRVPDERYRAGCSVMAAENVAGGVLLTLGDGTVERFDLVVGADGYRSTMRSSIHEDAEPRYAGYSAWRGLLDEAHVADADLVEGALQMVGVPSGHAATYMVPGTHGELDAGRRRINWLIYDGAVPRHIARVTRDAGGREHAESFPPGSLDAEQLAYLHELAARNLPSWHRDVVLATTSPYLQALYDLPLDSYVRGRVCLVGDAATLARPHTGSGASKALQDALALVEAMQSEPSIDDALVAYDRSRQPAGNALVALGQDLGRDQVVEAPHWSSLDEAGYEQLLYGGAASRTYFSRAAQAPASQST